MLTRSESPPVHGTMTADRRLRQRARKEGGVSLAEHGQWRRRAGDEEARPAVVVGGGASRPDSAGSAGGPGPGRRPLQPRQLGRGIGRTISGERQPYADAGNGQPEVAWRRCRDAKSGSAYRSGDSRRVHSSRPAANSYVLRPLGPDGWGASGACVGRLSERPSSTFSSPRLVRARALTGQSSEEVDDQHGEQRQGRQDGGETARPSDGWPVASSSRAGNPLSQPVPRRGLDGSVGRLAREAHGLLRCTHGRPPDVHTVRMYTWQSCMQREGVIDRAGHTAPEPASPYVPICPCIPTGYRS
ncbi:hypothetical protein CDD83_4431 [Cordyceps sp. RAO-2017]|nr:hypothetical protein CDD83_4431 [Cordyceps sp. RAO-2017]